MFAATGLAYTGLMSEASINDAPTRRTTSGHSDGPISIAGGPIAALLAAGLLGGVRDDVGSTNVALLLAGIVVLAALAGRTAGIVTALTAAMAFNYFHTVPYRSLRISGGRDIATVILLAALGLIVSEIGAWRRRNTATTHRLLETAHALEHAAALTAGGAGSEEVFAVVRNALTASLGLRECRFEPATAGSASTMVTDPITVLPRTGALVGQTMRMGRYGFELPSSGAALEVVHNGTILGRIIIVPDAHQGSALEDRRAAIALADLYAVALGQAAADDRHNQRPRLTSTGG